MKPSNTILPSRSIAVGLVALVAGACTQALKLTPDDSPVVLARHSLTAADPASPGAYRVRTMFYGSGTDKRRPEYRDSVTLKTPTVDAKPFVSTEPPNARLREKYWGFPIGRFPLNGRVWYPEGDGPFPLVLVVHGNHDMTDFSDPGYRYLGELMASRGYITVSVDQNFINGNLRGENDGRGWLLLKHLQQWKKWNDSVGSPFHRRVDMSRIALIGHSRGGEAVAHAAAFNRLAHFPDDANVRFDFNFDIKSIVAIAPVDGQYKPAAVFQPLQNVNYLVIHGSHDGDVSSFSGLRQYQRLRFTDGQPWFKSAWYVYRANHGQWNEVWRNKDGGPRSGRFLDLRGLISTEDQLQFGKVVMSAFLEATLGNKREYLPMFRDHRVAANWLPKTMYITRFQEAGFQPLATFEEDVDVTSGTAPGVRLAGDSLGTWKEALLTLRNGNDPLWTNGVHLGWNSKVGGPDTAKRGRPASYTITLSDSLSRALALDDQSALYMSLAPLDAKPGPRPAPKDTTKRDSTQKAPAPPKPAGGNKPPPKDTTPVDFTVEVVDVNGVTARVPIREFGVPRRPLEIQILRRAMREKAQYPTRFEIVLQTYVMPLAAFKRAAPALDPARLRSIRLVFDRMDAGTIVLDDVGYTRALDRAWWQANADGEGRFGFR